VAGRRHHPLQSAFGGDLIGPNPTDRAKAGTKDSLLVEADGGPLAVVVAGANVHDTKLLEQTLQAVVVERPAPSAEQPQHLCLDKAYDNPTGWEAAVGYGYVPHIRLIGEPRAFPGQKRRYPTRRWVVERTLAWLSKCRAILIRYDKQAANYLALIKLACGLLWYRRWRRLALLR
jgi:putative transposase